MTKILLAEMSRNLHEGPARSAIQIINALDPARYTTTPVFSLQQLDLDALHKQIGMTAHNVPMPRPTLKANPAQLVSFAAAAARASRSIARIANSENVALIHANSIINIHAALAASRAHIPLVLSVREMMPDRAPNRAYMRWICGRANTVLAVSQAVKDKLLAAGVGSEKIRILYNGIEPVVVSPERRAALRAEFGASSDAPLVGITGTITELKGQHILLEAVAALVAKFPDMRAIIIGNPQADSMDYMKKLEDFVLNAGLTANVVFTGRRDDVKECMAAFDVYVQASIRDDSLPRTVIEAMAVGTPVVGSRIGGIPEMVSEGATGFLVSPGDTMALSVALEMLFTSPVMRAGMGKAAVARVAEFFDAKRQSEKLMAVYDDVLTQKKKGA